MKGTRLLALSAPIVLASLVAGGPSRAQEESCIDCPSEPVASMLYVRPRPPNFLRLAIEEALLLALGFTQYASTVPASHFVLPFDSTTLIYKLTWQRVHFDADPYDSNQLSHPGAGTLYYEVARANGLGIVGSSLVAVLASVLWKTFGEFREYNTINDNITTPVAGIAVGESATQLGAFFDSGRSTALTNTLSLVFAPFRKIHDLVDGAEPLRTTNVDSLGFSRDIGHEFKISAGYDAVWGLSESTHAVATGEARTHLVNVAGYNEAGTKSRWLTNGNVSDLVARVGVDDRGIADAWLFARMTPVVFYKQDLTGAGPHLRGQRFFIGPTVGFDYMLHDFERPEVGLDRWSRDMLGIEFEHDALFSGARLRSRLALQGDFSATHSIAYGAFVAAGGDTGLVSSTLREQGYYWSIGVGAAPAVELCIGPLRFGGAALLQQFWPVRGLDAEPQSVHGYAPLHDSALLAEGWVALRPIQALEISIATRQRLRQGIVGFATQTAEETSIATRAALVF